MSDETAEFEDDEFDIESTAAAYEPSKRPVREAKSAFSPKVDEKPLLTRGGVPERERPFRYRRPLRGSSSFQFLMTCIGFMFGVEAIISFPSKAATYVAFLIAYTVALLVFGLPMIFFEMSVGQFTQRTATAFGVYLPVAQGVGVATSAAAALTVFYYSVNTAISLQYIVKVTTVSSERLAWSQCNNTWNNHITCMELIACNATMRYVDGNCVSKEAFNNERAYHHLEMRTAPEEFFRNHIMDINYEGEEADSFIGVEHYYMMIALLVTWILMLLAVVGGSRWHGKFMTVIGSLNLALLTGMAGYSLLMRREADWRGIGLLFAPDISKLFTKELWMDAAGGVIFSCGSGMGILLGLSSNNPRSHNYYKDALILIAVHLATVLTGAIFVFNVMGLTAFKTGRPFDEFLKNDIFLVFTMATEAINFVASGGVVWSLIFFVFLAPVSVASTSVILHVTIVSLCDNIKLCRRHPHWAAVWVCTAGFAFGVAAFGAQKFQNALRNYTILSYFLGGGAMMMISCAQLNTISFFYDGVSGTTDEVNSMHVSCNAEKLPNMNNVEMGA